jgi:hypothetical protein
MPTSSSNVGSQEYTGKHLLRLSSSQFDPQETFATQLPNTLIHGTNRRGDPRSVHGFIFRPVQAHHQDEFAIGSGEPVGLLVRSRGPIANMPRPLCGPHDLADEGLRTLNTLKNRTYPSLGLQSYPDCYPRG